MNTTFQLIDVLTSQPGELDRELAELDIFDHRQMAQTLMRLTRGNRDEALQEAEAQRKVVRLHNGR